MTHPPDNDKRPDVELKITADGSHTLFVAALHEHYHSVFGAIQESRHIFINAGLKALPVDLTKVEILEIGFGTGLNALLTCLEKSGSAPRIRYTAIERYPIPIEMSSRLNYPEQLHSPESAAVFHKIHLSPWNEWSEISSHFHLLKIEKDLKDYMPEENKFDLIFFDAFGPDVQPEMWTPEVFRKIYQALKTGGILVTYSTKGEVKRNLKSAGFSIEKLPGPLGKREMLRAMKTIKAP
jgi:tRNA U34 5-methylaminomethyl-2-thiouridine-forming methyltransferase MnmC